MPVAAGPSLLVRHRSELSCQGLQPPAGSGLCLRLCGQHPCDQGAGRRPERADDPAAGVWWAAGARLAHAPRCLRWLARAGGACCRRSLPACYLPVAASLLCLLRLATKLAPDGAPGPADEANERLSKQVEKLKMEIPGVDQVSGAAFWQGGKGLGGEGLGGRGGAVLRPFPAGRRAWTAQRGVAPHTALPAL